MSHLWDYRLGIHSRIPKCCVEFYVTNKARIVSINNRRGLWRDLRVQYVPCTQCLRRMRAGKLKPAQIHICRDSSDGAMCHRFLSGPDRVAGLPVRARYICGGLSGSDDTEERT